MDKKIRYLPRFITKENAPHLWYKNNDIYTDSNNIQTGNDNNVQQIIKGGSYGSDITSRDAYYRDVLEDTKKDMVRHLYDIGGVKVNIIGPYMDVTSVLRVLKKHPPIKMTDLPIIGESDRLITTDDSKKIKYIPVDDNHMLVKIGDKTYSGSGVLIIIKYDTQEYFLLFKSSLDDKYNDLGGKIDKIYRDDENVLFKNAVKEAKEESIDMFDINTNNNVHLDIKNNINDTYYRIYVYKLEVDSVDSVTNIFHNYTRKLATIGTIPRGTEYYETNNIQLFACDEFYRRLNGIYHDDISSGVFITYDRGTVRVNGRCMKGIHELYNSGKFGSVPVIPKRVTETGQISI